MMILAFAAALLAADTPAAADAAKAPEAASKSEKTNANGLVCKREAVLGSRLKSRVCLTQAQWDQRRDDSRAEVEAAQRNKPLTSN